MKINDFKAFYNIIWPHIIWFWKLGCSRSNLEEVIKTCRWNFFNFSWVVHYRKKYVKIKFKNRGPSCYFIEIKRSKILQKLNKRDCYCNILGLTFYGVCHSKYIFNFVFGSVFEQDHLLNLCILAFYAQRWPKCACISKKETEDDSIRRSLNEKKKFKDIFLIGDTDDEDI